MHLNLSQKLVRGSLSDETRQTPNREEGEGGGEKREIAGGRKEVPLLNKNLKFDSQKGKGGGGEKGRWLEGEILLLRENRTASEGGLPVCPPCFRPLGRFKYTCLSYMYFEVGSCAND